MLQQYLPFKVLKLTIKLFTNYFIYVATVLAACGIETHYICNMAPHPNLSVATVLTACGIETK